MGQYQIESIIAMILICDMASIPRFRIQLRNLAWLRCETRQDFNAFWNYVQFIDLCVN